MQTQVYVNRIFFRKKFENDAVLTSQSTWKTILL